MKYRDKSDFVIPVHPPGKSSGALWLHEIEHVGFGTLCASGPAAHTADVRALEASQFHVADAATLLTSDPTALLYVATVLAQRLDSANRSLLELKRQVQAGEPRNVIGRTVEKIEALLGESGNLMYAGYPTDPFA